jgi:hypothetical protein
VGHISADQSDDLCRIATGFGYSTRTLFSTDEETTFEFARPQIVTAIDSLVTRDDLADRVLMVQLGEITEQQRLPQAELNAKIEAARPRILGALLTALSQTLAALPDIEPDKLPRMADYAKFAIASEKALGLKQGEFMSVFNDSRELSRQVVIESSPVGEAIIRLMENRKAWEPWQGTASELLNKLENYTDEATYRSRYFPKTANVLKRQLNRLAPDLKALGIDVREARLGKAGTRIIVLEKVVILSSVSSAECQPSEKTSQDNDLRADDNADDIFTADDKVDNNADDILMADDKTEDIVSHRTAEHERVSSWADDADDKNLPLTSSDRLRRFKIGDLVRFCGKSVNLKQQYAGNLTIREFSKSGDSCTCLKPNGNLTSWIEFDELEFVAV